MAHESQSGPYIEVDTRQLTALARDLRMAAPAAYAAMRADLRVAANVVAEEAKQRSQFSHRIPASIRPRVSGMTAKVLAGGEAAPEGAPLENKGKEGTFRHPLFGSWEFPQVQQARPFLAPALRAKEEQVAGMMAESAHKAVARATKAR